ncbi:tetratricopeptide repeat protein [uncultured Flavobacterium sp.]|uniref:ATP-binding protein n=1 Tax=uncultured Flavobacterium sp. TaxID=165435 RepID=UPI0025CF2C5D|nr:tetratricopeptide repeat protein [uncultured Flavobacterium sp.]
MKKHHYLFFIIGLLLIGCSDKKKNFTEGKNSDSLNIYLAIADEDTVDVKKRIEFNNKALEILLDEDNDSLNRENLFLVANRFYNMNRLEEYRKVTKIISKNSIAVNDNQNIAKAYSYLGDYYASNSKKDSAFLYYTKAEKIYIKLKDNVNLGSTYVSMALVQNYESDFLGSQLSAVKALNILRGTESNAKIYEAYNILGVTSYGLKDYGKAIEYHTKALNLAEEKNLTTYHEKASSLNNLGSVYQEQNKHELAISRFKEALKNKQLFIDKPKLYATLIDNLAYSKLKLKDFQQLPDLFYKSLRIRDSINIKPAVAYTKNHLSEFYAIKNDTIKAKKFAREALELSKAIKSAPDMLLSLKQMGIVDPENASFYSNEYIRINDSLQQAERRSKDKFARISFETDEYILQNDKLTEQNRKIIFSAIILILLGTLVFVIKNQHSKNKEFLLKQAQQKANEEIYDLMLFQQKKIEEGRAEEKVRIAQELHDGILGRLFGARLNLDSLNKRQDEDAMASRINFIAELKSIEQDIREISHDLSREKNEVNNNFIGIFNNLIEQQESISNAKVHCHIDKEIVWDKIENNIKINLYRILQESLQNINKYAQAENITIEISRIEEQLSVMISDDGIGFSVSKKNKGIGLKNIISRTHACEGTIDIKSKINKGTTINLKLPIYQ